MNPVSTSLLSNGLATVPLRIILEDSKEEIYMYIQCETTKGIEQEEVW